MSFYCISAKTKDPVNSAKLVDFLLNSEEMAVLQGTEKGVPLSRSALEVLESRDMLSDVQAVANKKLNENRSIRLMSPYLENESLIKEFFSSGDDVTFNSADTSLKSVEVWQTARNIGKIEK